MPILARSAPSDRVPTLLPALLHLALLAGCASAPSTGGEACPRPAVGEAEMAGLPAAFDPAALEGRWRFTVVTARGLDEPRAATVPLVLAPAPDSLYVHPFCLGRETCAVRYPLRGWVERPLDAPMAVDTDPTSTDPERPGAVLEWRAASREAVLVFGNPPVRGRLAFDVGASFSLLSADAGHFTGFWNGGGLGVVVSPDGRQLGPPGGWFCAVRTAGGG